MFKNTYFGRRGSAAIALKYARMNQKDKKEEKKPVTVAKDDKDIIEALKTHMEMAEAIEAGLAQPQQTVETQHHDMQEDIDIADSIPLKLSQRDVLYVLFGFWTSLFWLRFSYKI